MPIAFNQGTPKAFHFPHYKVFLPLCLWVCQNINDGDWLPFYSKLWISILCLISFGWSLFISRECWNYCHLILNPKLVKCDRAILMEGHACSMVLPPLYLCTQFLLSGMVLSLLFSLEKSHPSSWVQDKRPCIWGAFPSYNQQNLRNSAFPPC